MGYDIPADHHGPTPQGDDSCPASVDTLKTSTPTQAAMETPTAGDRAGVSTTKKTRTRKISTPTTSTTRRFKSECIIIAVDDTWFYGRGEWVEHPAFAQKYGPRKVHLANADAQALQDAHSNKRIRIVRCKQSFALTEFS